MEAILEDFIMFKKVRRAGLRKRPAFFFVITGQEWHKLVQTDKGEEG